MELGLPQFRWYEQFHGIPRNFNGANFADMSSSMELHGIWSAPISLTWAVPWSSMKFHGTRSAPISIKRAGPWNSMEFHGTRNARILELGLRQFRWHEQFHGIPWNFECTNFDDTSSSMEFHITRCAPISISRAGPWNSMEPKMRQFCWHEQFHGIPRNFWCANFDDTSSSMEFHGNRGASYHWNEQLYVIPWNSTELGVCQFRWHEQFHGIPWNSMELGVRQFRWHEQFHGIPWNSLELGVCQFRWHEQFHEIPWNSMELQVRQFRWHK